MSVIQLQSLCGNDSFLNPNQSWFSKNPTFTDCFQNSLQTIPSLLFLLHFILITLPRSLLSCLKSPSNTFPVKWTFLHKLKLICNFILIFITAGILVWNTVQKSDNYKHKIIMKFHFAAVFSSTIVLIGLMAAVWKENVDNKKRSSISAVLFSFYFLSTLFFMFSLINELNKSYDSKIKLFSFLSIQISLLSVQSVFCCIQMVLYNFCDNQLSPCNLNNMSPQYRVSIFSRLTFSWVDKLIWLAFKNKLEEKDIYKLHPKQEADYVFKKFEKYLDLATDQSHMDAPLNDKNDDDDVKLLDLEGDIQQSERERLLILDESNLGKQKTKIKENYFLLKALFRRFGGHLVIVCVLRAIGNITSLVDPLMIALMINFVENHADEQLWHGVLYVVSFFLIYCMRSLYGNWSWQIITRKCLEISVTLSTSIYNKALILSNGSRSETTIGKIVNLQTVDVHKVTCFVHHIATITNAPIMVLVVGYWLWQQLNYGFLVGMSIFVIFTPINRIVIKKVTQYEIEEMKMKDDRMKILNEILNGIKAIKLYAWEIPFGKKVTELRDKELHYISRNQYVISIIILLWMIAPYLILITSFAVYIYSSPNRVLTASKAFVSLELLEQMRNPLTSLPIAITRIIDSWVALGRLQEYFERPNICLIKKLPKSNDGKSAIQMDNCTFSWTNSQQDFKLQNFNLSVAPGKLVAIVGKVGCGKSTFLESLLGETLKESGDLVIRGSVSYVSQEAWIQNLTIRSNILFGQPMNSSLYEEVVTKCQLLTDFSDFPAKDLTEIGERGINLSGGQKQRVALARAVYQQSDIYLFDDPLAAVDAHVGQALFDQIIGPNGCLANTTRLLVTHNIKYLAQLEDIIVLDPQGRICERGSYDVLVQKNGEFESFLRAEFKRQQSQEDDSEECEDVAHFSRQNSANSAPATPQVDNRPFQFSQVSSTETIEDDDNEYDGSDKKYINMGKLIKNEESQTGRISLAAYKMYLKARKWRWNIACVFSMFLFISCIQFSSLWLANWTMDPMVTNSSGNSTTAEIRAGTNYYMLIYSAIGGLGALALLSFRLFNVYSSLIASKNIHNGMLDRILHCPIGYFDSTPTGRILNRFSKDVGTLDKRMSYMFNEFFTMIFEVLITIGLIGYTLPVFLLSFPFLLVIYFSIFRLFVPLIRQARRYDSVTTSPVVQHFKETLHGVKVIRAHDKQESFVKKSYAKINCNYRINFLSDMAHQWFNIRMDLVGSLLQLIVNAFCVWHSDTLPSSLVAVLITYASSLRGRLHHAVHIMKDMETETVAIERIKEYSELKVEADWVKEADDFIKPWPTTGRLEFLNYSTKYRENSPTILKSLRFSIQPGYSVGVVGRTGAGKSSLALALFRLLEATDGLIKIDDIDIGNVGLHTLRSNITILPQEPMIFAGTLRSNLDPFEEYPDDKVWRALEASHLTEWIKELPEGLEFVCSESGNNLSVGQKQLLCLARAVLRKSKLLILDEATAAVDLKTDQLVMRTIREVFKHSTVLIIAHRLATVMHCNLVMVMDSGKVKEIGPPQKLMNNEKSVFHSLINDATCFTNNNSQN